MAAELAEKKAEPERPEEMSTRQGTGSASNGPESHSVDGLPDRLAKPTDADLASSKEKDKNENETSNGNDDKGSLPQPLQPSESQPGPLYSVFSPSIKMSLVLITVFATFFSPFSSFIYLPAITPIANAYHRSVADINLSVTVYQVMQAVAPLFFGDLSDQIGRRPVYMLTFAIYLGANIGLALQHTYPALMALRALQSTGSSATVAIGSAVMADFTTSADRGGYITAVQASIGFAPALAPVFGGILTQFLGWRATFWFLVISAGVFLVVYIPFAPESARRIVGNGSVRPPPLNMSITSYRMFRNARAEDIEPDAGPDNAPASPTSAKKRRRACGKIPFPDILSAVRIVFEKDIFPLMLFMSLFVMANFAMLVPLEAVIRVRYHFNDLQVGLCYIPFAMGSVLGAAIVGRLLNWNYARVARSIGLSPDRKRGDDLRKFPIERARLDLVWPCTFLAVAMMIAYGWIVEAHTNLAAPLIVLFFAGAGLAGPISILTTMLVDLYPMNPGRVSSAFNLTRATLSAIGSAVIQYIIDAWGYGFTYLFMGLLVLAGSSGVVVVRIWGPQWREERYQRMERANRSIAQN